MIGESLMDVETIQDSLRVILEMITDTVTQNDLRSLRDMLKAQERIIVLTNNAHSQIQELGTIAKRIKEVAHA